MALNLAVSCVLPSVKWFLPIFLFARAVCVQAHAVCLLISLSKPLPCAACLPTVDGGWDEWSEWTVCSSQCERQRSRECNSPAPRHRGKMCEGSGGATENCTDGLCTQSKPRLGIIIIVIIVSIIVVVSPHRHFEFRIHVNPPTRLTWQIIPSMTRGRYLLDNSQSHSGSTRVAWCMMMSVLVMWHICMSYRTVSQNDADIHSC